MLEKRGGEVVRVVGAPTHKSLLSFVQTHRPSPHRWEWHARLGAHDDTGVEVSDCGSAMSSEIDDIPSHNYSPSGERAASGKR